MTPAISPGSAAMSEPDLAGKRLGDYQLLRRLGRGGMADVYLAEQLRFQAREVNPHGRRGRRRPMGDVVVAGGVICWSETDRGRRE